MALEMHGGNIYKVEKERGIDRAGIIDFSVNLNPLGCPPEVKELVVQNIDRVHYYPDPDYYELREALAAYHALAPGNIICGNGACELIYLYCRTLRPRSALIAAPTFSEYARALEQANTRVTFFELHEADSFNPDVEALKKALQQNYDLLVLCNPNNPTGVMLDVSTVGDICKYATAYNTHVMLDESFIEFVPGDTQKISAVTNIREPNLFVLRSLTKILSIPGLRLGYAAVNDVRLIEKLSACKEPWSINIFAASMAAILDSMKSFVEQTKDVLARETEYLCSGLNKITWLTYYKPAANFILLKILNGATARQIKEGLLKYNILIRDASNFHYLNDRYIRIAVKDRQSNKYIIECLQHLF